MKGEQGKSLRELGKQGRTLRELGKKGKMKRDLGEQGKALRELGRQGKELREPGKKGSALLMLLLPATLFHLVLTCRSGPCSLLSLPTPLPGPDAFWSPRALLLLLGWLGLQAALYLMPVGSVGRAGGHRARPGRGQRASSPRRASPPQVAEGLPLRDETRLRYPINGFRALALTSLLVGLGLAAGLPLGALADLLLPLASAAALTALGLSLFLYLKALRAPPSALAPGGNTGHPLYDFFLGRELNPRIGAFDLKYFCELRPGLMGWALLNLALLLREAELRGGRPSLAMGLVNAFQLLYVADALWHEPWATTSSEGPTRRRPSSGGTPRTPGWPASGPSPPRPDGGSWCPAGGAWSGTPTTSETSSWPWPGPCPAESPTSSPTSTSSTSPPCWCTARPATSTAACASTAWPGASTAGACPIASCPTSTEPPAPPRLLRAPGADGLWPAACGEGARTPRWRCPPPRSGSLPFKPP
ncbi:delta(14)-sterol reductase TM7SF2 isoform X1 [Tachyglossus aculeatus]|uniref:delta(14)-sterol reductase TM7SF2 isoform X1 n=1 Tax=Tachyglossus aculeatus TaxID=9261 RepID=UPI0018F3DB98|nr:delta(14)-sterol reductase TM7SF2 isoform X1 [Tachyglossus aculeatus]